MDIQTSSQFQANSSMRLTTHAMRQAALDKKCQFVLITNKPNFLPLVRCLQVPSIIHSYPNYNLRDYLKAWTAETVCVLVSYTGQQQGMKQGSSRFEGPCA